MTRILLAQELKDGIAPGVPADVKVASKSGWTGAWFHDAGIVFPPNRRPYVLVILTKGYSDEASGWNALNKISGIVHRNL
jgi:beta-lactamase class A